jgi:uncharacterized repeat protein (TIGR03803 family)
VRANVTLATVHGAFSARAPHGGVVAADKARPDHTAYHFSVIYSFQNGADGGSPNDGNLIADLTGALYGSTESGGNGLGVVYKLTPSGSGYTQSVLHAFQGSPTDGGLGFAGLLADKSGALYGTTFFGGVGHPARAFNRGAVYKLTPSGSGYTESVLYSFQDPPDGRYPIGTLIADKTGALYGATGYGGVRNNGIVFKLTPSRSGYSKSDVYRFHGHDGRTPYSGVIADQNGALYGTTEFGSDKNLGVVFKLTPSGSGYTESVLHSFQGFPSDGANPVGDPLIPDGAGGFYGTTTLGGARGYGNVFRLRPSDNPRCGENFVNPGKKGLLDGVGLLASYQLAGMQTDPNPPTGWTSSSGLEIGDLCFSFQNSKFTTGMFPTWALWSNASTACVQSGP